MNLLVTLVFISTASARYLYRQHDKTAPKRPNILVLTADALGIDELKSYGNPTQGTKLN